MFFFRPSGSKYYDRGIMSSFDKQIGQITNDNDWHEWDISGIIAPKTKLIFVRVTFKADGDTASFYLRIPGDGNVLNCAAFQTGIVNKTVELFGSVAPDADGLIEYRASVDTFAILNVMIRGWIV